MSIATQTKRNPKVSHCKNSTSDFLRNGSIFRLALLFSLRLLSFGGLLERQQTGELEKIRPWGLKAEVLWWYSHDWKCTRGNPTKHWGHMKAFFWPVTPSSRKKFCPADDGCLHIRWRKMDCRVYCSFLYMGNMILPPKFPHPEQRHSQSTSVGDWSHARIHLWPKGPDQGGYIFFTNVIAQTSAKAERTWLSAVWNHICAHVYVYLGRRWYGSTGKSKVQLAIIFGLYSLQAILQDASQRLISRLFFVSQGAHLLYELLDLIYNSAKHNCDVQSSEDQSLGKCHVSTRLPPECSLVVWVVGMNKIKKVPQTWHSARKKGIVWKRMKCDNLASTFSGQQWPSNKKSTICGKSAHLRLSLNCSWGENKYWNKFSLSLKKRNLHKRTK